MIISCIKHGPVVYPIMVQTDSRHLTPHFEGFIVKGNTVATRFDWHGYYGKIPEVACENCILYVRELFFAEHSAFSSGMTIEEPSECANYFDHLDTDKLSSGLSYPTSQLVLSHIVHFFVNFDAKL